MLAPLKKSYDKSGQCIKKQRHYFANKGPYSQSYCFSVVMYDWDLDHKERWKWKSLSCVWLFATPWTTQSREFSRIEYWSGYPFSSPGDLPNPRIKPRSPPLQADSLPVEPPGKPKERWRLKNWCFGIVVLEKTLESPLDSKEIKPFNPKRNQPWIFIGRTEAQAPILWPPNAKS